MAIDYYSFDPRKIPWQWDAIKKISKLDFSQGTLDIGFCGIVGSAKTTLAAWLTLDHCARYKDAKALIGRRSFSDLKETSFSELSEMVYATWGKESDRWIRVGDCSINFPWGAQIIGGTWGDGRFEKFKSKNYSWAWLEEPTENSPDEYNGFLNIFRPRVGRVNHNNSDVQENAILYSFNAHDPEHPIYEEFYTNPVEGLTYLFESKERENPFLHENYYENLLKRLDPLNVKRQIFNEWAISTTGTIYHAYDPAKHFKQESYQINRNLPVHISWDFNVADGKPLSVVFFQYSRDHFHFFDEIIIEGIRTEDSCEEIARRGYFNYGFKFILHGDATGKARSTNSKLSDWMIIKEYFTKQKNRPDFKISVPKANPPIRKRHNLVNSYMENGLGENRITLYNKCKTLNKGFKWTAFKKGSNIENDNNDFQHCTTSAGYGLCSTLSGTGLTKATSESRWR